MVMIDSFLFTPKLQSDLKLASFLEVSFFEKMIIRYLNPTQMTTKPFAPKELYINDQ